MLLNHKFHTVKQLLKKLILKLNSLDNPVVVDNMDTLTLSLNQTQVKALSLLIKLLEGLFQENIFQQFKKVLKKHFNKVLLQVMKQSILKQPYTDRKST